jgi:hypothetical protein
MEREVTFCANREANMLSRKCQVAAFVVLSLVLMFLGGCVDIQVIDRTPSTPDPSSPVEGEEVDKHDLAVLAVDFDPPLEYEEIVARKDRGEGITLLVAVENTGASSEQDVGVEVELCKDQGETVFLHKQGSIEAIAPGEIKIIRFKDTEIPFSYEYLLRVQVVPVFGEARLRDNQRSYDLLITQP